MMTKTAGTLEDMMSYITCVLYAAFCLASLGLVLVAGVAYATPAGKVTICHFPPDSPSNFRTMSVSPNSLSNHLAHGDFPGPCSNNCNLFASICDDGDLCTVDTCDSQTGLCESQTPMNCDDSNVCTDDLCDGGSCVNTVVEGRSCDDGDACTASDACTATGVCAGEEIPECCGPDCGYQEGDVFSYTQGSWGANPNGLNIAQVLTDNFAAVYPLGFVEVGIPGAAGFSMRFTAAAGINNYQPATGVPNALSADLVDPESSASGTLGGHTLALLLNVDFSDAGLIIGSLGIPFGDLTLCNLTDLTLYEGLTVREYLGVLNTALSGGLADYSYSQLNLFTEILNDSFGGGTPSVFAQDHLCKYGEGDVFTYTQSSWGANPGPGNIAQVLADNFAGVYPGAFVEVGIPGAAGFSMRFTGATAINSYQPSTGAPAALNADLVDPVSSSSGSFGGNVLALRLNVDFSDAGLTLGSLGIPFGDLTLCNLSDLTLYEGLMVRDFLGVVNTALGGGVADYSYGQLDLFTDELNGSFHGGTPGAFAQDHLCQ